MVAGKQTDGPSRVLFLCTGNSSRSIMAEAILNRIGSPRFEAYSAGSHPKGKVHPEALRLLADFGYETGTLRSKSWNEFFRDNPVAFDSIVTVCNNVAEEACPAIAGRPARMHWDIPDPSSVSGNYEQIEQAFRRVYDMLSERIGVLIAQ